MPQLNKGNMSSHIMLHVNLMWWGKNKRKQHQTFLTFIPLIHNCCSINSLGHNKKVCEAKYRCYWAFRDLLPNLWTHLLNKSYNKVWIMRNNGEWTWKHNPHCNKHVPWYMTNTIMLKNMGVTGQFREILLQIVTYPCWHIKFKNIQIIMMQFRDHPFPVKVVVFAFLHDKQIYVEK